MHSAFPDRFALPKHFVEIAALDRMGKKNGKGFYSYKNNRKTSTDRSIYSLVRPAGNPIKTFTNDEISRRCMLVFTNEAIRCLDDGIIQHPYDGEVGAVFGLGFPPFLGGPFKYADLVGIKELHHELDLLSQEFGQRFSPARTIREYAEVNRCFFPDET